MEIDWGALKLRFHGKGIDIPGSPSFAEAERKAWNEGLLAIQNAIANYHQSHLESLKIDPGVALSSAKIAGERVAKATYSYRNEYFDDGTVLVHMESSLANALLQEGIEFRGTMPTENISPRFTGVGPTRESIRETSGTLQNRRRKWKNTF